ncbi:iron(III) ABC transporter permease [Vreelandella aquamarina]|uniref:ABC transporter permease n=1 Tax=Halomonadaceae TaxID=28256 RepID=UPI0007846A72|nr:MULTISPECIES: iron ABC transporter permease [Halomonas]MCP1302505.1 iron ABC transporter permease [Halomonas sp. R1t8]MCP1328998.1 iron ABC transporter permease [Halomonas sp. R1t4]GED46264.1 iron(III) ABC transporter permease [Halomonas meridiana]
MSTPARRSPSALLSGFASRITLSLSPWSIALFLVALIVALPILVVLGHIVMPTEGVWQHLASTVLPRYLSNTFWLVLWVGLGTLVIGTGTAWLVVMCRFPGKRLFEWALLLPLAVPTYVIAYAYTDFLQVAGPLQSLLREWFHWQVGDYYFPNVRSLGGAATLITFVLYPYVYLLARASFLEQSVCVLDVGRTLGRGPWRLFASVALPLARPALVGGVSLVLMETLNEFGAVQFFGVDTFTTGIYRTWFGLGEPIAAAQLAACLLTFVIAFVLLERWSRGKRRYFHTTNRYQQLPEYRLHGWHAVGATLACLLPVTIGFMLPSGILLEMAMTTGDSLFGTRFIGFAMNSLSLATVAALIAVGLAVLLSYGVRLHNSPSARLFTRIAAMGYAIPGSVVAVGILIPFAWLDNALNTWLHTHYDKIIGLVFSGTAFILIYAYVVRFLAVSFNAVEASLGKVTPSMDAASRTLGQTAGGTLRRIHTPLMRSSLLAAGILVFVDVMKELPATIILRPFNFDTLAVRAHSLASDERLAEASTASLTIVVVGILPVILLSLAMRRARPGSQAE